MICTTQEMLKKVVEKNEDCLECVRIIGENIHTTYFIYHKKTFKNGKISFCVDWYGEETWTNYDFLELYKNKKWLVYV